ncbi:MAG: hypothetical protein LUP94_02635 [Candidatus Methanomethylicus sp.]|nr:hypothetical protein [Candidatus Methanomethylicus sp.]
MVKYGTLEYFQAVAEALNKDAEFVKSGMSTTYIYRFTDRKNASGGDLSFLLKFDKGKVVEIKEVPATEDAEFIGTGPYDILTKISKGELDGQQAMKDGTFKFKYFLFKAARYGKTLTRMGEIARTVPVEY